LPGYDERLLKGGYSKRVSKPVDEHVQAALENFSDKARKLLAFIPQDEYSVGNKSLRIRLGFSEEEYLNARKELLYAGLIKTGPGRGGSVSRTTKGVKFQDSVLSRGLTASDAEQRTKKDIELVFMKDGIAMKTAIELPIVGRSFHEEK